MFVHFNINLQLWGFELETCSCSNNMNEDKSYLAASAHLRGQFLPYPPVSQLVLLVSIDIAVQLQQVVQRMPTKIEETSSLVRIKHVHQVQTKVFLQPFHICISTMKDLEKQNK